MSRVRLPMGSLGFFIDLIFTAAVRPWGQISLQQKWVLGLSHWGEAGEVGLCVGLTTLPPSSADCLEILGASTSWSPKGLSRPVKGYLYLYLLFLRHIVFRSRFVCTRFESLTGPTSLCYSTTLRYTINSLRYLPTRPFPSRYVI
jgi:hypothetical protein